MDDVNMLMDSEWNEAKAYFYRIHLAINASDEASLNKDYERQLLSLYTLHRELSGQMTKDELEKCNLLYKKANVLLGFSLRRHNMNINLLKNSLYDYELYLRQIMKDRKMDMPRRVNPGSTFLNQ